MKRKICLLLGVLPCLTFAAEDMRQLVKMPLEARAEMRAEMLDFQTALNVIIADLGDGKFADAANTAEGQIGLSAMGRHRNAPMNARPGMHMPADMHGIARGMHAAGSDFAKAARSGDLAKSLQALTAVTGACVACHRSYRTQ
ncbi:MAG: cytochrome c [Rhodocyclaceae bacterium]|jgi:soluble cytochrome b562|nr:cytochrome c [Rhodocyclaceae bacterium]MBK6552766.1 cytochrome c [Rhodocyclaceae bacterium]MBK6676262.1 cytochrome c [Rhodocyclaceae bacterium]MBK7814957.1 cytochrome c [Rhodocyclaceae bacterium]MBK9312297.1 cytochrome c [Rhodocyclaceae bacterium]